MLKNFFMLYHLSLVDWCGKKSNLKQFSIRQQQNMKTIKGYELFRNTIHLFNNKYYNFISI